MKKFFYSVFVASTMLMATSCSQENELVNDEPGGEATQSVTFTIETGVLESRTAGDGKSVDRVNYEVWSGVEDDDPSNDVLVISSIEGRSARVGADVYKPQPVTDGKATVKLNLVRNVAYDVTFWADDNDTPYDISGGLDNITYKNTAELLSNKENYDAFYQTLYDFKVNNGTKTVKLRRPFAQINVGTTVEDWNNAIALGVSIDKSEVKVNNVKTVFDAHTREAKTPQNLTFKLNNILNETFQIKDDKGVYTPEHYQFLGMNYMFADTTAINATESGKTLHSLEIALNMGTTEINKLIVNNMPMQRNWRTNIVGNLLTGEEEFQIIVDPEFDGEYNTHVWDGESIHRPYQDENGNWIITTAAELAWVSSALINGEDHEVKGRAAQMTDGFKGQTIKLAYDIDLNGKEWTPIGTFKGTFDGQGHKISNAVISPAEDKSVRGFFNTIISATIQNLTLDNIKVDAGEGEHAFAGVLAGESYGTFKLNNVTVQNSDVKGTNKIGGMVGFVRENQIIADNCHVINTNVTTHDVQKESGLAGGFIGYIAQGNNVISNCSVTGGTLTFINARNNADRSNGKFIGGIGSNKVELNNCSATPKSFTDQTIYESPYGELIGGTRGTNPVVIIDGGSIVTSTEALADVLKSNEEYINIFLTNDAEINASDAYLKLGGENTRVITIEGNNHKITLATTYWSRLNTVNPNAKIVIKNATLTSSQETGTWNSYDVTFQCAVELENVILEKALALDNAKKTSVLKNVTIKESHDYYALWISAAGQSVVIEGGSIESAGRGIKIDDQYCNEETALVSLSVSGMTFKTAKKAAVMVKSTEGAVINWGEGNDISEVEADSDFAVWVDEDGAAYADRVTVNGALCKVEGSQDVVVESTESLGEAIDNMKEGEKATFYLSSGEYETFPASSLKEGVTISCEEGTIFEGTSSLNVKGATVIGATFKNEDGKAVSGTINGTFKNCTFEGEEALRWCYTEAGETSVFENCEIKTDFRGFHFDNMKGNVIFRNCRINGFNAYGGDGTATFEGCTFGNDASNYNGLNIYSNTILKDCTFNYVSGKTNFIDMEGTGKTLTITNCTATLDGNVTEIGNFIGGSKLKQNTVTINGKAFSK